MPMGKKSASFQPGSANMWLLKISSSVFFFELILNSNEESTFLKTVFVIFSEKKFLKILTHDEE